MPSVVRRLEAAPCHSGITSYKNTWHNKLHTFEYTLTGSFVSSVEASSIKSLARGSSMLWMCSLHTFSRRYSRTIRWLRGSWNSHTYKCNTIAIHIRTCIIPLLYYVSLGKSGKFPKQWHAFSFQCLPMPLLLHVDLSQTYQRQSQLVIPRYLCYKHILLMRKTEQFEISLAYCITVDYIATCLHHII